MTLVNLVTSGITLDLMFMGKFANKTTLWQMKNFRVDTHIESSILKSDQKNVKEVIASC